MKVLIAEDDHNKVKQLEEFLRSQMGESDIVTRSSYQSSLKETVFGGCDLILLDMSMPTYDVSATERGGRTRPFAGREILDEIRRRRLAVHVIVVTQFDRFGEGPGTINLEELRQQLTDEFPGNYVATIYYDPAQSNWRDELQATIEQVREILGGRAK